MVHLCTEKMTGLNCHVIDRHLPLLTLKTSRIKVFQQKVDRSSAGVQDMII
jgi:hypothetical protein